MTDPGFDRSEPGNPEFALPDDGADGSGLWPGDTGILPEASRRAFLALLRGPYLAYSRNPQLWSAMLRDEAVLRSRLSELFLDLIIDLTAQVAYVRNVDAPEVDTPKTVRTASLTFLDTAMLLVLRQHLVSSLPGERVIVGKDEITEQLDVYRGPGTDDAAFEKRVSASWANMKRYGFTSDASADDRVEISPVLRLVFGPEQIALLQAEYRRIAAADGNGAPRPEAADEPPPIPTGENE